MDDTLVVYDSVGALITPCTGSFVTPQSDLHYLIVKVPQGKYPKKVDVTTDTTNHQVVYEDLLISDDEQLRADIDYLLALQEV